MKYEDSKQYSKLIFCRSFYITLLYSHIILDVTEINVKKLSFYNNV